MTFATTSAEASVEARRSGWDWRETVRNVAIQVVLVVTAYHAYRFVRTLTEGNESVAFANSRDLLRFEELAGLDVEQGIQSVVLRSDVLIDVFNRIYVFCFWPLVTGTLVLLFVFKRPLYRHYRNGLFISGGVGLVVFAVYPVAPPRMLDGFVDTVHVFTDATSIARPGNFTNQYAAMPSFHVGWLVLAGAAVLPLVRRRWMRPLVFVPAVIMTITIMATANHYLVDAIAGSAVAIGGLKAAHAMPAQGALRERFGARVARMHLRPGLVGDLARGALIALVALAGGRAAAGMREATRSDEDRPSELLSIGARSANAPSDADDDYLSQAS